MRPQRKITRRFETVAEALLAASVDESPLIWCSDDRLVYVQALDGVGRFPLVDWLAGGGSMAQTSQAPPGGAGGPGPGQAAGGQPNKATAPRPRRPRR